MTPLFHLPAVRRAHARGRRASSPSGSSWARRAIASFSARSSKPLMVRFDPNSWIPKTLKFPRPKELLLYQLEHDDGLHGPDRSRARAGQDAGGRRDRRAREARLRATASGACRPRRRSALAEIRSEAALDGAHRSHRRARHREPEGPARGRQGAGHVPRPARGGALKRFAEKDPSYYGRGRGHARVGDGGSPLRARAEYERDRRRRAFPAQPAREAQLSRDDPLRRRCGASRFYRAWAGASVRAP